MINAKVLMATVAVAGFFLIASQVSLVGQKKAVDVSSRFSLENQLLHVRDLQKRQEHLINQLKESHDELQKRHAAVQEQQQGIQIDLQQHKEESTKQEPEKVGGVRAPICKDHYDGCEGWEDCCPGNIPEDRTQCSKQDCSQLGKPCEGGFMKQACPVTCGICKGDAPDGDNVFQTSPKLLSIYERTKKDSGTLENHPTVTWQKWHEIKPRVVAADNVVSLEMANTIMKMAQPKLRRSQVVHPKNSSSGVDEVRTSSGMWLSSTSEPVKHIRSVVSELVGLPESHFEELQILRYQPGQFYVHHSDFFEPHMKDYIGAAGNRVATAIVFLNSIPAGKGGDTKFPFAKPKPVSFTPKQGSCVLFYNIQSNGRVDRKSEHEAVPPAEGEEKWVAITWIRENPFD